MSRFSNPVPQFWLNNGQVASMGRMYFYENKNYSSLKDTFSQPDNTVENTNPVKLDDQGRVPPCFGEGLYSVKLYAANPDNPFINGELVWTRDDVDLSAGGDAAFSAWSPVQTYGTGSIVKDGEPYYRLYGAATSSGEQPSVTPTKWEKVIFITEHIVGRSYPNDYVVFKSGRLYASNIDSNSTTPPSASWDDITFNNAVSGNFSATGTITSAALNVSGAVTFGAALPVAQGGTGATTAPLARASLGLGTSSVLAYQTVDVGLNGDLGGTVRCSKNGNTVTIAATTTISHASSSAPVSGDGIIPAAYRPISDIGSCYVINRTLGYLAFVSVLSTGRVTIEYNTFAGAAAAITSSPAFSVSFNN